MYAGSNYCNRNIVCCHKQAELHVHPAEVGSAVLHDVCR